MTNKLYTQSDMEALRERCAKVAENMALQWKPAEEGYVGNIPNKRYRTGMSAGARELAALLRALAIHPEGQKP